MLGQPQPDTQALGPLPGKISSSWLPGVQSFAVCSGRAGNPQQARLPALCRTLQIGSPIDDKCHCSSWARRGLRPPGVQGLGAGIQHAPQGRRTEQHEDSGEGAHAKRPGAALCLWLSVENGQAQKPLASNLCLTKLPGISGSMSLIQRKPKLYKPISHRALDGTDVLHLLLCSFQTCGFAP